MGLSEPMQPIETRWHSKKQCPTDTCTEIASTCTGEASTCTEKASTCTQTASTCTGTASVSTATPSTSTETASTSTKTVYKTKNTTNTSTTLIYDTTTVNGPSSTNTAIITTTTIISVTSTSIFTVTMTSTTSLVSTSTVAASAGFLPIESTLPGANFAQKKSKRNSHDAHDTVKEEHFDLFNISFTAYTPQVVKRLQGEEYVISTIQETLIVQASPSSTVITKTSTVTETKSPSTYSSKITVTSTSTNTVLVVTTTTSTTTTTSFSTTTAYAACASNNIANRVNNKPILNAATANNGRGNSDITLVNIATNITTAYDCCVASLNNPATIIFFFIAFPDGELVCRIAESATCAPIDQVGQDFTAQVSDTEGFPDGFDQKNTPGSGYCGEVVPAPIE
ncbi:hypothetical protein EJ08DRAFT_698812 [Tothia fuscella]|uniref:Uncharacterized protein n=1 Tax=Tothia fuscella TaxID=1048955 RepID=A0A9P4TW96_9PEZI|nr:hypothetical protein EJ08DRAFT_698812 [Tothia fuscella]